MNSSKIIGNFPAVIWTPTVYFSNSTGSSVTNCRFSPIIGLRNTCTTLTNCKPCAHGGHPRRVVVFKIWSKSLVQLHNSVINVLQKQTLVCSVLVLVMGCAWWFICGGWLFGFCKSHFMWHCDEFEGLRLPWSGRAFLFLKVCIVGWLLLFIGHLYFDWCMVQRG